MCQIYFHLGCLIANTMYVHTFTTSSLPISCGNKMQCQVINTGIKSVKNRFATTTIFTRTHTHSQANTSVIRQFQMQMIYKLHVWLPALCFIAFLACESQIKTWLTLRFFLNLSSCGFFCVTRLKLTSKLITGKTVFLLRFMRSIFFFSCLCICGRYTIYFKLNISPLRSKTTVQQWTVHWPHKLWTG